MSRAFVNEDRLAEDPGMLDRPVSEHPNYVTPRGLALLEARVSELSRERAELSNREDIASRERLAEVERDLRYYNARVESAITVPTPAEAPARVTFGCRVTVMTPDDAQLHYTLVGEDEAEVEQGRVSWVSPLGKALLGAAEGDVVIWQRPAGDLKLEVLEIGLP